MLSTLVAWGAIIVSNGDAARIAFSVNLSAARPNPGGLLRREHRMANSEGQFFARFSGVEDALQSCLAVILDLHFRRVIGWAVSNRMKRDLALRSLNMAIALRCPPRRCIHHTDRGSQYCSRYYQKILRKDGFRSSMSGTGICYDNAVVKTFSKHQG
jgi:transposase InsO family protein